MKDIQSQPDHRRINIKKVGVKNISYPVALPDKADALQRTVATVNMYVNLPHRFKGTHMSRFVEILNRFHGNINLKSFHDILLEMKAKLQAEAAHMEIEFPYFLRTRQSPVDGLATEYACKMHGSLDQSDDLVMEVRVPISPPSATQLNDGLPRSPGQWGYADVSLRFRHFIWVEDLITIIEEVVGQEYRSQADPARCREKLLTVEELTRQLGKKLASNPAIRWFSVTVENFARGYSIFATLEWPEK